MENGQELVVSQQSRAVVSAADFMPLMTVQQAIERKHQINQFVGGVLKEGEDYGTIPGAGTKKVLLKPGAEKLCSIFGLSVTYAEDKIIEDWTGDEHNGEPLFYYSYRCQLSRGGLYVGEAIGSCNSWESKYRYRWVPEEIARQRPDVETLPKRGGTANKFEPQFALDKRETTGQYGKPAEYWAMFDTAIENRTARRITKKLGKKDYDGIEITIDQTQYRIPNPDVADAINTCQKMAQKRSLVAAVLVVTNCSDAFTQDIEDFDMGGTPARHSDPPTPFDDPPEVTQRSEPAPRRQAAPTAIPEQVQKMWGMMTNSRASVEIFEHLRDSLESEGAGKRYPEILKKHGVADPGDFKEPEKARKCARELWELIEAHRNPAPVGAV